MRMAIYTLSGAVAAVILLLLLKPAPAPPPPVAAGKKFHFAEPGTFFVLAYTSVNTPKGIIGFEPGREVHLVSADKVKKLLRVTDGKYEADLSPNQLTNDIDIAALARNADESSQQKVAAFTAQQRAAYDTAVSKTNSEYSKDVDRINADRKEVSAIGTSDLGLNRGPTRTNSYVAPYYGYGNSYSPYSYVYPGGP